MSSRFAALSALCFSMACGQAATLHAPSGTGGNTGVLGSGGPARSGGAVGWGGAMVGAGGDGATATGGSAGTAGVLATGQGGAGGGAPTGDAGASTGSTSGGGMLTGGALALGGMVATGGSNAPGGALTLGGSPSGGGVGPGGARSDGGNLGSGGSKLDGATPDGVALIDGRAVTRPDASSSDGVDASPSGTGETSDAPASTGPTLELVAGALGGEGAQDGTGPVARFYEPGAVVSDGNGVLFVADRFNQSIRKVVVATGVVTTLAGSPGVVGHRDGPGRDATFGEPSGVAFDGAGNLFVADSTNHLIRAIDLSTGTVSTIAGFAQASGSADGAGASALFYYPGGLAYDGAGNLFVADVFNHTIRKIVVATGEVTTLAGTARASGSADGTGPAARFNYPGSLLCDGAGNLLVTDTRNSTIRSIVISTGAVTTLVGSAESVGSLDGTGSAARLDYPAGMGSDGLGNVFFADSHNHSLRKLVLATATVTTLAGSPGVLGSADGTGSAARFYYPDGVAVDGANLYVADLGNNEIRAVVIATGAVTTLAGAIPHLGSTDGIGPAARFFYPRQVASDGAGNLFVTDTNNSTVRQIVIATGAVTTFLGRPTSPGSSDGIGSAASFSFPVGIASDGAGNLFISDSSNSTIRKVVIATRAVTTLAGLAGSTGSTDGTGTEARFHYPTALVTDGAGNLFVADTSNQTIRKIAIATAVVTTLAGSPGNAGTADGTGATALFNSPAGLASDGAGNLFVADSRNHTLRKVVIATGAVTTVAGLAGSPGSADGPGNTARLDFPESLATDGAGSLYIGDLNNHSVRKFDLASQSLTTVVGGGNQGVVLGPLPGGVHEATGLAFVPKQGLYIVEGRENAVLLARF